MKEDAEEDPGHHLVHKLNGRRVVDLVGDELLALVVLQFHLNRLLRDLLRPHPHGCRKGAVHEGNDGPIDNLGEDELPQEVLDKVLHKKESDGVESELEGLLEAFQSLLGDELAFERVRTDLLTPK